MAKTACVLFLVLSLSSAKVSAGPMFEFQLTTPTEVSVRSGETITVYATFLNLSSDAMYFAAVPYGVSDLLTFSTSAFIKSGPGFPGDLFANVSSVFSNLVLQPGKSVVFPFLFYNGSFENTVNIALTIAYQNPDLPTGTFVATAGFIPISFRLGTQNEALNSVSSRSVFKGAGTIPEPDSWMLFASGFIALVGAIGRKRTQSFPKKL